ncbi:MAG: DUF1801 domain-containing protein [Acidimicrobiia bacterium]
MSAVTSAAAPTGPTPSELIDGRIAELADWRGDLLSQIRAIVRAAAPDVVEEWKWRGVPVWYCDGMITTGETHKSVVKMTFANGAALKDPKGLFNSSLDGNVRRAIDFKQGDKIPKVALTALVKEAIALNRTKVKR